MLVGVAEVPPLKLSGFRENKTELQAAGRSVLPLVGSFKWGKSGVNSVDGLLHQGLTSHIVISESKNHPSIQCHIGPIGIRSITMILQKPQNALEEAIQRVSVAEIVRQRLAS